MVQMEPSAHFQQGQNYPIEQFAANQIPVIQDIQVIKYLKYKFPMDFLYQWCNHQPNFVTFVEYFSTMLVATKTTRTWSKLRVPE